MEQNRQREISESVGIIFLLERRLAYLFDQVFAESNLTAKQWLVLAAVEKLCAEEPAIQEVARQLSTSHQNIKAIALNLEKRGFITLYKDEQDKRVTRMAITEQCKTFWADRGDQDQAIFAELFQDFNDQEKVILHSALLKLLKRADKLPGERSFKVNE